MQKSEAEQVFLFAYFTNNGEDGLHLAYSSDGFAWKALGGGRSFLRPAAGIAKLMRDPCILQGPDGVFHMVWTAGWSERGIGYAFSPDLMRWSEQRYLEVMGHEPQAMNCWAPELLYDDEAGHYMIYWSTTIPGRFPETDGQNGRNHRIYYTTTEDFSTTGPVQLLFDQGFNVIDASIARDGERYIMFLKDETNVPFPPQKNIRYAMAERPQGPYGPVSQPITGPYWAEGPSVLRLGREWIVYFDRYRARQYGAVRSADLITWEDISDQVQFPEDARHGAVLPVTVGVVESLLRLGG